MRLIRADSDPLIMEEFSEKEVPPYAVLSHTWGKEEVSFAAFNTPARSELEGFRKIQGCCEIARSKGWNHVWIDTCCIDKSSSAELSEAINSMWIWYEQASECFVFLSDVSKSKEEDSEAWEQQFNDARWFQRGWTLQELLAPSVVLFYDKNWKFVGSKDSLKFLISIKTGIDYLDLLGNARDACVAQKMAWAAHRKTSRSEDIAYCLLGLFDINMPLLYGERQKAFYRLQQEIIRKTNDETIFARQSRSYIGSASLFALSPNDFWPNRGLEIYRGYLPQRQPYVQTNRGLQFEIIYHSDWIDALSSLTAPSKTPQEMAIEGKPTYAVPKRCIERSRPDEPIILRFGVVRDENHEPIEDLLFRVGTKKRYTLKLDAAGKQSPLVRQIFYIQ